MTEDDTYELLRRVSYKQMRLLWSSKLYQSGGPFPEEELNSFFKSYGWTVSDYTNSGLNR